MAETNSITTQQRRGRPRKQPATTIKSSNVVAMSDFQRISVGDYAYIFDPDAGNGLHLVIVRVGELVLYEPTGQRMHSCEVLGDPVKTNEWGGTSRVIGAMPHALRRMSKFMVENGAYPRATPRVESLSKGVL